VNMKPDKEFDEARDVAYRATSGELRQIVERIERIEADEADLRTDKKEFYVEAKGRGYDTRALRKIVTERKRDKDDLAEEQAVMLLYREALGM